MIFLGMEKLEILEIRKISDNKAPMQGGKEIFILCHKLKTERNEKIIPQFSIFDENQGKDCAQCHKFPPKGSKCDAF